MLFHLLQHFYVQQMVDIPYLLSDISIPVGNMWAVQSSDWVSAAGTGRQTTFLTINLLTPRDHSSYCGVVYSNVSSDLILLLC